MSCHAPRSEVDDLSSRTLSPSRFPAVRSPRCTYICSPSWVHITSVYNSSACTFASSTCAIDVSIYHVTFTHTQVHKETEQTSLNILRETFTSMHWETASNWVHTDSPTLPETNSHTPCARTPGRSTASLQGTYMYSVVCEWCQSIAGRGGLSSCFGCDNMFIFPCLGLFPANLYIHTLANMDIFIGTRGKRRSLHFTLWITWPVCTPWRSPPTDTEDILFWGTCAHLTSADVIVVVESCLCMFINSAQWPSSPCDFCYRIIPASV